MSLIEHLLRVGHFMFSVSQSRYSLYNEKLRILESDIKYWSSNSESDWIQTKVLLLPFCLIAFL